MIMFVFRLFEKNTLFKNGHIYLEEIATLLSYCTVKHYKAIVSCFFTVPVL